MHLRASKSAGCSSSTSGRSRRTRSLRSTPRSEHDHSSDMGLISGLLTLPLAPVRGTIWIAEQLLEQAERELGDETTIRRELAAAEPAHDGTEGRRRSF